MNINRVHRRTVVRTLSCSGIAILSNPLSALAESCERAVRTDAGPFYPEEAFPSAWDLTTSPGTSGTAAGRILYVSGKITTPDCAPLPGTVVEIWQTDDRGHYRHPRAEQAPLDPSFRYFASVPTAADGSYAFKTIQPRPYTFMDIRRAPHIHIRLRNEAFGVLTSEIYFEGEGDEMARGEDRIFQGRGARKGALIIPLEERGTLPARESSPVPGASYGRYDVAIETRG